MLIPDSKLVSEYKGPNGCYWPDNEEDGCVVNWGRFSATCSHLQGVEYKGRYYPVTSTEFRNAFKGEEIDFSQLSWDCRYEQG